MVEAARDVVEVRQRVAGERRRLRLEGDELDVEPGAPVGFGHLGGEAGAECGRVVAEACRGAELLHVDLGLERGRPEVAVDEPGMCWSRRSAEEDVVAGDRVGRRDRPRAADGRDAVRSPSSLHLLGARGAGRVVVEVGVGLAAGLGEALGERGIGREAGPVGRAGPGRGS